MAALELDEIITRFQGRSRDALLPVLWEIQSAYGHISPEMVRTVSHVLRVPEADIYGVIGFYTLFHEEPTGESIIHICTDPACGLAGADAILDSLCDRFGITEGETTPDQQYTIERSPCLGLCEHAPAALITRHGGGDLACAPITSVDELLREQPNAYGAIVAGYPAVLTAGITGDSMERLSQYGDYAALRRALHDLSPEAVISSVRESGLVGRGGAAFPTGVKWESMLANPPDRPRYVICNADESEPGTFKDRVLLEGRPHLLLEGMALAGYAVGAHQGYLFIRGEYPDALSRLQAALEEAVAAGFVGDNIMGSSFSFHIEIRRGAGAYICGEETALFEAIEGKRGFPRIKPPYPTTNGLFDAPTAINNVETLCAVPGIVRNGEDWFRQWGTEKSTGTKLVSVSGHVQHPGVYEITPGITLRTLLEDYCGGVRGRLQAVLMGGAAGTFLTPDEIDVRLSFEDLRAIHATFGSGAVMVFNDTVDLSDVLQRLARFFKHESCGKCFPCQLGTQRQMEILERADTPLAGDRQRLLDIGMTMTESSLCGLGQTAASAILSALAKWPELFSENGTGGKRS